MTRVLVAEDSATVRELLVHILEQDPGIAVVGFAENGREAVDLARRLRPDLITMDINMPIMDGLAATKEIMTVVPTPILIVSSRANDRDIQLSLEATRAGALMIMPKPDDPASDNFEKLSRELVSMVKALARVKVVRHWAPRPRVPPARSNTAQSGIRVIALATSTGGPAALQQVLAELPRNFPAPILIVQHIAPGFVAGLATWLGGSCKLRVKVAEANEPVTGRTVYLAPDDTHLGVTSDRAILLSKAEAIGGFRPSANFLFKSVAECYGQHAVGVVLTGMGRDGVSGACALHAAGARMLAQDEATSVVYGMPREAFRANVVHEVLGLHTIAGRLIELVMEAKYV